MGENTRVAAELRQARAARRIKTEHLDAALHALDAADDQIGQLERRNVSLEARAAGLMVNSPRTYGPDSPHSWFLDLFRNQHRPNQEAEKRLQAHAAEVERDRPRRNEARTQAAERAYFATFAGTPGERRALADYTGAGGVLFERRAATRVDGSAGYEVPPAWLIDQAVPAPRADAALAAAVTQLPLPPRCDTVNIPRVVTGTGTGTQPGDVAAVASRDLVDSFVDAPVRTLAGQQDVSAQWLDQGLGGATGGALDQLLWNDLHADMMLQLDGNLILGSGSGSGSFGQTLGLLPPQTAIGTSLAVYAPNGNTGASQTLYNNGGSGTTLGTTIAQCISGVARARGKYPTHILTHPWVWAMVTAQTDQQSRPLVEPRGPHPVPDGAAPEPGVVGYLASLPVLGDLNIPTTIGGTGAPYLGPVSGVQFAGQPGTGASALYTPVIPVVADDVVVFLGEPKMRLLREVLAGTAQYRFQLYCYAAAMVNRYQAIAAGSLPNSGGWAANACSSYGVVTQNGSNSLLSITGQGF